MSAIGTMHSPQPVPEEALPHEYDKRKAAPSGIVFCNRIVRLRPESSQDHAEHEAFDVVGSGIAVIGRSFTPAIAQSFARLLSSSNCVFSC